MINYLQSELTEFSIDHFGPRTDPRGPLNHLKREIIELIDAIDKVDAVSPSDQFFESDVYEKLRHDEEEEWADNILLLLDAFRIRYGKDVSVNKLLHFALNKLEVVKKRTWSKEPDEEGVFSSKK